MCSNVYGDVRDFEVHRFTKATEISIQKSQYLENKTLFFRQLKKFIYYTLSGIMWQKIVF